MWRETLNIFLEYAMNHDPDEGSGRREPFPPDEAVEDRADYVASRQPDPHGRWADFIYDPLSKRGFE